MNTSDLLGVASGGVADQKQSLDYRLFTAARHYIHLPTMLLSRIVVGVVLAISCLSSLASAEDPDTDSGISPNLFATDRQALVMSGPKQPTLLPLVRLERDPIAASGELVIPEPGADLTGWSDLTNAAVDRIEAWASATAPVPPQVATWFAAHPQARRSFWLSLSPDYDHPAKALDVLNHLIETRERTVSAMPNLAIAMALVYDQPDAVLTSRYIVVWGVQASQFPDPPTIDTVWDWLTNPAVTNKLNTPLTSLPISALVHMVDLDVSAEDYVFVLKRHTGYRNTLDELYASVLYDQGKAQGDPPWLGSKPYTLRTIAASGGVCTEQAYYASRIAKILGTPALIVRGRSRASIGRGHAWLAFLSRNANNTNCMAYGGRYNNGRYYTGEVFDPQTRTRTIDRELELVWASGLRNPEASLQAAALVRLAELERPTHPARAASLAREAVILDDRCGQGWLAVARSIADGSIPLADANRMLERMLTALEDYPDVTAKSISIAVSAIPQDQGGRRQRLWDAAYAIYKDRPDLRLSLRQRHAADLIAAGQFDQAVAVINKVLGEHGSEGALILPVAEWLVDTAVQRKKTNPSMNLRPVRSALETADAAFPKTYRNKPSDAYLAFRAIIDRLK
ncbi:MAG TPA: hypothetical protein DCS97_08050 [Planctomycetes bacterium]|nr:hypothetical protein [Planctomycetota bacterium]